MRTLLIQITGIREAVAQGILSPGTAAGLIDALTELYLN